MGMDIHTFMGKREMKFLSRKMMMKGGICLKNVFALAGRMGTGYGLDRVLEKRLMSEWWKYC